MSCEVIWVGEDGLESWNGTDPAGGVNVTLNAGDAVQVSPELAAHLQANFAHLATIDGQGPTEKTAPEAATDADADTPTIEKLLKQTRAELDALAAVHGIEGADGFADKRTVATAILATIEDDGTA